MSIYMADKIASGSLDLFNMLYTQTTERPTQGPHIFNDGGSRLSNMLLSTIRTWKLTTLKFIEVVIRKEFPRYDTTFRLSNIIKEMPSLESLVVCGDGSQISRGTWDDVHSASLFFADICCPELLAHQHLVELRFENFGCDPRIWTSAINRLAHALHNCNSRSFSLRKIMFHSCLGMDIIQVEYLRRLVPILQVDLL